MPIQAASSIIRNLPSKRLYNFDSASCPKELQGLIGGKIKEPIISANWPDILRDWLLNADMQHRAPRSASTKARPITL